jgi:hypothetical protein
MLTPLLRVQSLLAIAVQDASLYLYELVRVNALQLGRLSHSALQEASDAFLNSPMLCPEIV